MTRWARALALGATLHLAGCLAAPQPSTRGSRATPPLPYTVRLEPAVVSTDRIAGFARLSLREEQRVLASIEELALALGQGGVFTEVVTARPASATVAAPADLIIRFTARADSAGRAREMDAEVDRIAASAFLWLYGVVPAWFLSDRSFEPLVDGLLEVRTQVGDDGLAVDLRPPPVELRFYERASAWACLGGVVVPPALLPSDLEAVRPLVFERSVEALGAEALRYLRRGLVRDQIERGAPLLVPPGAAGLPGLLLLDGEVSRLEIDSESVESPARLASWLRARRLGRAAREQAHRAVRAWLLRLDPAAAPLPAGLLGERYPTAYRVDELSIADVPRRVRLLWVAAADGVLRTDEWTVSASSAE